MAEVALRDYLHEIDRLIDHGSIEAALQHSRHFLLQYPKAVEVYRLMGKALLEREDDRAAQDVFQRVLSVDPEDFVARVGLSIVHDRNNELELAIWHMERAFDIAPSNALIQGELRRLYARRDGESPERIPLTRDALARMYAQGDLNAEAIADLRQLLHEQPDRLDLQVQMAEVLWRDEQRVEASELTQKILNALPYCLKANLIMGVILRDSGATSESEEPLQTAQAVDPDNLFAMSFFGGLGPLVDQRVMVDRLDLETVSDRLESSELAEQAEEVPEWLRGISEVERPLLPESEIEHAPRLSAGLHMPDVATEIPDWLQGLTAEPGAAEADVPDWLANLTGAAVAGAEAQALTEREKATPEEPAAKPAEEEVPDWINQLGSTGTLTAPETIPPVVEEEQPDWMAQLRETSPTPFSETILSAEDTETPDWLAALTGAAVAGAATHAPTEGEEAAPEEATIEASAEEMPDWTNQTGMAGALTEPDTLIADEQPAWLAQFSETPPAPFSETIPTAEDAETPDWLAALAATAVAGTAIPAAREDEGIQEPEVEAPAVVEPTAEVFPVSAAAPEIPEEMPSADDALAFFAKLAAGKEDQLRAEAQAEADVRMAEIMGRKPAEPKPVEPKPVEPTEEGKPVIRLATTGTAAAVVVAAATKLKNKLEEPEQPVPSATPVASVEPPPEVPEEMPSADDALAFFAKLAAGKEDQLRAEAEAEADVRMAAIMGRKPVEPVAAIEIQAPPPVESLVAAESAAEVPDEMPSADDALAFFAKLAAGKEDQLRAQAQLDAESRMDAIMGRKPAPATAPIVEERPDVGLAAAIAAVTKQEPTTLPIEPSTSSLEEPADWSADLSASAVAEPVPADDLPDWLKQMRPPEATLEPADELPEWLQAMRPAEADGSAGLVALFEEEAATEEMEGVVPTAEIPAWLRSMQPGAESEGLTLEALTAEEEETGPAVTSPAELPAWLLTMRPAETAVEAETSSTEEETSLPLGALAGAAALGLAAPMGEEESASEEPTTDDLLAELAALEQAALVAEIEPAPATIVLSHDWWAQSAEDTGEEAVKELPDPFLSARARSAEKEKGRTVAAEKTSVQPRMGLVRTAPTGPLAAPEGVAPSPEVEALLARVSVDQKDYAARLDLARTYWATGNREDAYSQYLELVTADEYPKEVMSDLETIVEIYDRPDWHRLLGDVCMKAGKLSQALAHYRQALNEL